MERKEKNINTKIKQVRHHVNNLCREQKDLNSPPENIYGWAAFYCIGQRVPEFGTLE